MSKKLTDCFTKASSYKSKYDLLENNIAEEVVSTDVSTNIPSLHSEATTLVDTQPPETIEEDFISSISSSSFPSALSSTHCDLNINYPTQPRLATYPKTKFGKTERAYSSSWYNKCCWLEYLVERDACFCFPCRIFGINIASITFTEVGYKDWKHALDSSSEKKSN